MLAYLFFFKYDNFGISVLWLYVLFFILWLFLTVSEGLRSWKGTTLQINILIKLAYLAFLLFIIVILPSPYVITGYSLLILIIGLTSPQILIYGYKIKTKRDFGYKYAKLVSRLSFIFAIFFMLLNIRSNIISRVILLVLGSLIFTRIRAFTSLMVDQEHMFHFRMFEKTLGKYLSRQGLIIEGNQFKPDHYLLSRKTKSIFVYFFFALIFIFGVISLKPISTIYCKTHQTNSVATILISRLIVCKSISSQPFVKCINCRKMYPLSRSVPEFCSKCGTELIPEEDLVYVENNNNVTNIEEEEFGLIEGFFLGVFLLLLFVVWYTDQLELIFGLSLTLALLYAVATSSRRREKDSTCKWCCIECGLCC